MKRTDMVRKLTEEGCVLVRHGGNHDWYRNPKTGISQPHRLLCKSNFAGHFNQDGTRISGAVHAFWLLGSSEAAGEPEGG
jgi:hypothetical protein